MPVRKRKDRHKQSAGLFEWESAFESGFDMFSDLHHAGIELDKDRRPDLEEARAAWRRYGDAFMADFAAKYPSGAHFVPWALAQLGDPR
jgi:hypothetical protein